MHNMSDTNTDMNWDDLRFVIAVARHGSLLRAARELGVDHTTVGRRISSAEHALSSTLFTRHKTGLVLTADGERLIGPLQQVEDAVLAAQRRASADRSEIVGTVKITAPESFGIGWLAPRLAHFSERHKGLRVDLEPSGAVLNLNRREAEIALRTFRSKDQALAVRRACDVGYGLYASRAFLARTPIRRPDDLAGRPLLTGPTDDKETRWLAKLSKGTAPTFTCVVAVALVGAAKAGAGVAVLPRYLGDAEPELTYLPMPDEPHESLWLTVHRDLRTTPRVRAVLDFLVDQLQREKVALRG
jgi:DNA-binding transcriptional LysR family regulator